jgi:hypothetical protein
MVFLSIPSHNYQHAITKTQNRNRIVKNESSLVVGKLDTRDILSMHMLSDGQYSDRIAADESK